MLCGKRSGKRGGICVYCRQAFSIINFKIRQDRLNFSRLVLLIWVSKLAVAIKLKGVIICFCTAVLIFALSVSAYFSGAYAVYFGATPRLLPIYSVGREDKVVSISFDCAWGTEHTDDILNALRVGEVKATWFMVEFWTEKYSDFVKKIDSQGHEIGTHSATHSYMSKQNAEEIKLELKTSSEAITNITGKQVELFRPPYGDYDNAVVSTLRELGHYTIQWDVDSLVIKVNRRIVPTVYFFAFRNKPVVEKRTEKNTYCFGE